MKSSSFQSAASEEDGPPKKRRSRERTKLACDPCNKSKHSCDGGQPCGRCTRSNKECTYFRPGALLGRAVETAEQSGPAELLVPYLNLKIEHLAEHISPKRARKIVTSEPTEEDRTAVRDLYARLLAIAPTRTHFLSELRNREVVSGDIARFPPSFSDVPRNPQPTTAVLEGKDLDGFVVWTKDRNGTEEHFAGTVWVLREPHNASASAERPTVTRAATRAVPTRTATGGRSVSSDHLPTAATPAVPARTATGGHSVSSELLPAPYAAPGGRSSSMASLSPSAASGTPVVSPSNSFQDALHARPPSITIAANSPDYAPELRKTFRLLIPVIDAHDAAALIEDADGRCISANLRFCATFGIQGPPDTLVGLFDCGSRYIASQTLDPAGFDAATRATILARSTVSGDGYEFKFKDGRVFQRDYVAVTTNDEPPEYAGHIFVYRDVTMVKLWLQTPEPAIPIPPIPRTPYEQPVAQPPKQYQPATLVEDENRKVILTNRAFTELFRIPVHPDALIGTDCSDAAVQAAPLFADPKGFVERISVLLREKKAVQGERILMANGMIVERDYFPCFLDANYLGHVWSYKIVPFGSSY